MKINGLFQCGMLLLPVSFGQFGTSSVDLCSTLLLGLSKGGGGLLKIGVCEQVGSLKHHLLAQARVCVVSSPSSERNLGW